MYKFKRYWLKCLKHEIIILDYQVLRPSGQQNGSMRKELKQTMKTSNWIQYSDLKDDWCSSQPFLLTKGNWDFHAHTFSTSLTHVPLVATGCLYCATALFLSWELLTFTTAQQEPRTWTFCLQKTLSSHTRPTPAIAHLFFAAEPYPLEDHGSHLNERWECGVGFC